MSDSRTGLLASTITSEEMSTTTMVCPDCGSDKCILTATSLSDKFPATWRICSDCGKVYNYLRIHFSSDGGPSVVLRNSNDI